VSNSKFDTYYCDGAYVDASRLADAGGDWDDGSNAGAFRLSVYRSASGTYTNIGARLMYLN
jgi:hypothetical protein